MARPKLHTQLSSTDLFGDDEELSSDDEQVSSMYLGFVLRFVKGGNKFAIASGRHLVDVSQGMMGVRWLCEEWKPNMAKLKVSIVFDERKCSNQKQFLPMDFQCDDVCWMFLQSLWKKFPKQG